MVLGSGVSGSARSVWPVFWARRWVVFGFRSAGGFGLADEGILRFGCTQFSVAIIATLPVTASGHPGNVG